MAYIGREPLGGEVILLNSIESQFNGVLTTFNLTRTVSGATSAFYPIGSEQLLVSLGGVIQRPDPTGDTGFRIAFNTIIFAVAPVAGTSCFIVAYGNITDIGSPANNTVTTEKLVDGAVTPVKLSTGGPWWLSNGNVGIGTANPGSRLHVFASNGATGEIRLQSSDGRTYALGSTGSGYGSSNNFIIYDITGSVERFRLNSSGNIGIGTTNPLEKLHVESSLTVKNTSGPNTITIYPDSINGPTIVGHTDSSGISTGNFTGSRFRPANGGFFFDTSPTTAVGVSRSWTTRAIITDTGNVGIGSTNPQAKLDVSGGILSTGITVSNGIRAATIGDYPNTNGELPTPAILVGTSGNYPLSFIGDGASGSTSGGVVTSYYSSQAGWRRAIEIFNTTSATGNLLLMKTGGNVGISTNSPAEKFHIHAPENSLSVIRLSGSAVLQTPYNIRQGIVGVSNAGFSIYDVTAAATRFAIDSAGNIGIGIGNPSSLLHLFGGDVRIQKGSAYTDVSELTFVNGARTARILSSYTNPAAFTQTYLAFHTNVSGAANDTVAESMRIAGGNVGIGTTNPQKTVHIYSSSPIRFEDQNRQWDTNIKDGKLVIGDNTASADRLTIGTTGNVGIGTTIPTTALQVQGTGQFVSASSNAATTDVAVYASTPLQTISAFFGTVTSVTGLTGDQYSTAVRFNGAGVTWGDISYYPNQGGQGHFRFSLAGSLVDTFPSAKVGVGSLFSAGNVGIGITNPTHSLHVRTSSSAAVATLESTQSGGDNVQLRFRGTNGEKWAIGNNVTTGGTGTNFDIFDLVSNVGRFRINASGNVGIGTTDPQDTLHVYGSNSDIVISNTSTGSAGLLIRYLNGTQHGTNLLYNPGSAITYLDNTYPVVAGTVYGDMYFRQNVGGTMTNRIVIKGATGRIGIGTDTPSLKFHVYDSNTVARFESSSSYVDLQLSNSVSSVGFIQYNGGDLRFFASSGSTPSITIKGGSPGNVGIGTTNPSAPLHVQGNTYITGALTAESYGYARFFVYDAPASPDGTGYVWIRASMGGFNGGGDVVKFSLGRAIWENNSSPYGGLLLDVTGTYSREWHSGQEFFTATYGYHGAVPGSGWVLNAGPRDLAGGGAWFYLRLYAGVRYYFRYPMSSGYISPTWEQTTDPGAVPTLNYGVNILGNLGLITTSSDIITRSGNLVIGTSGRGIDFSANPNPSGMTSELLNDYEEGTWTPVMVGLSAQGSWSPSSVNGGYYVKVGRQVTCWANVSGTLSGASGVTRINGLPFTRSATNVPTGTGNAGFSTGAIQYWLGVSFMAMGPLIDQNNQIYFHTYTTTSSSGGEQSVVNGGHNLHFFVTFYV